MKIFKINIFNPYFQGQRQDRKNVAQLQQDNEYDLNVPNQRKISQSIENLSKIPGESNVNFLLDVAENLKYGTNIDLGKKAYNDWHSKLQNAAKNSLAISDRSIQEKLQSKIEQKFNTQKPLNNTEKEILENRKSLLSKIDYNSLENIPNENIKNVKRNLDYFIVSSEVPTAQKLYILKRLNYFMSPEYKINPQLKDKKSQALSEIINDIVINTPESKIPNIKAINQKQHGICASISICRKLLAYEDKPNYVDMVLSELEDSDTMQVYDINKLGTHTKIPISKCYIDFDYALAKGYRIVDTSAMYWMNIADTAGSANEAVGMYSAFDKQNFDTWADAHLRADMDSELINKQDYYRALLNAKSKLETCKKKAIENNAKIQNTTIETRKNIQLATEYNKYLNQLISKIAPNMNNEEIHGVIKDLRSLEIQNSNKALEINDYRKDFIYLPNETQEAKLEKIKAFLTIAMPQGYNTKLLNKYAPEILDLTNSLKKISNKNSHSSGQDTELIKAKRLYSAAAAYRTQYLFQLDIPEYLAEMMDNLNISDDETRITENMDLLIKKLKKDSLNPEVRKRLAINFESSDNNDALIASLEENKNTINYILTDLMDNLYQSSLCVSRKNVLLNELKMLQEGIELEQDKTNIINLASRLGVKDNARAIQEKLDSYISKLQSENCPDSEYISIYRQLGHTSQLEDFKNNFEQLGKMLFEEPNENIIKGFNALNGINPDSPIEETLKIYNRIAENFNNISNLINQFQQALKITDDNGNILNTTDSKEIILKKLENMGELPSAKELQTFNDRFTKIAKIKSELEVKNNKPVKNKDLPQELVKLTQSEKETLKRYENNINIWYSMVTRKFNNEYRDMKEPLEELHRQIGVKTGSRWIGPEGQSGLNSRQQVKIIEHMTDRPYYIEYDGKLALAKIKESPYSGISSTSVSSHEAAGHAQYVVDVKPIQIKTGDKYETKDVIVHDNTWGASEHENTWIDENGLLRTDYQNGYGGALGFITDENYRNGNIAENLLEKSGEYIPGNAIQSKIYKKLNKSNSESYKFPMFFDMITPGKYPNPMTYVQMIRQNTLLAPAEFLDELENLAKGMTRKQLKAAMQKVQVSSNSTNEKYNKMLERINGDNILSKGILTREDYNNLAKDDSLKILLEKTAIIKSYSSIPDLKLFYKANSANEIKQIKEKVQKEARKNFNYTFAKDIDITKYAVESSRNEIINLLEETSAKNNIKLTQGEIRYIINSMKHISPKDFDGNLNHTIELMVNELKQALITKTPNFANKQDKIEALANSIRNILKTNTGFTLADLNNSSFSTGNLKSIVQWIDNTFDPATDEEFVQIFNNLQNMTTAEFNRQFNSKIKDTDLGIKNITGYDILTQIRAENEKTLDSIFNIIYSQESSKDSELSKTTPSYDYHKFERKYNGGKYIRNKRSFDDIYSDYYYSLLSLNLDKSYNKIRQQAFEKYGMFPAFPKVNHESDEELDNLINNLYSNLNSDIDAIMAFKAQIKSFEIINHLQNRLSKLNQNQDLTKRQKSIITKELNEFATINDGDETIAEVLNRINTTIETGKTAADFSELVNYMQKELNPYQKTADGTTMDEAVKLTLESLNQTKKDFIKNTIEPKYQKKAFELLNKWISIKSKASYNHTQDDEDKLSQEAQIIYAQFLDLFEKHRIFKSPEKVLNEFLLMNAKDARPENIEATGDKAAKAFKDFEDLKQSYKINLQSLLFNANLVEIQDILMRCAKNGSLNIVSDSLKNSELTLKNGTTIPLDSDIAISYMLSPMLADSDLDTAVMFVEQLNLAEKVIEMASKNKNFQSAYKNIKRIHSILESISKQSKIIDKELQALQDIDNDKDYINRLKNSQKEIIRKFMNTNYRITADIYSKSIDNAIEQMKNNPERSKSAILNANMDTAKTAAGYVAKQNIETLNNDLLKIQIIQNLISRVKLPENSSAEATRQKYLEEFKKIEEYKDSFPHSYSGLNLTVE